MLADLYVSFIMIFFCYPDPDQRFLKWIWIRPNDTDPKHCYSSFKFKCSKIIIIKR